MNTLFLFVNRQCDLSKYKYDACRLFISLFVCLFFSSKQNVSPGIRLRLGACVAAGILMDATTKKKSHASKFFTFVWSSPHNQRPLLLS